jgi:hypothetical protein
MPPEAEAELTNRSRTLESGRSKQENFKDWKRREQETCDVKQEAKFLRRPSDDRWVSQERETQAVPELQNVVGPRAGQCEDLRRENDSDLPGVGEVLRANGCRQRQRIKVLAQEHRWLSAANEAVKGNVRKAFHYCSNVKQNLTNVGWAVDKLKKEMRATRPAQNYLH